MNKPPEPGPDPSMPCPPPPAADPHRGADLSRDVLDALHEGCQVLDHDWRYLYLNDAAVLQNRQPREALLGFTMMERFPGIEKTGVFAAMRRTMVDRTFERVETEFEFPDGTRSTFEVRSIPVPQGLCILSIDITERRHRLAAIVADSDDAIVGRTLSGHVTSWNRSAERLYGYSAAEMLGRHVEVLFAPGQLAIEEDISRRVAAGERVDHVETVRVRKDGSLVELSITISPVRDANGAIIGVSTIARDIGEFKRLQRELEAARDAAEAANKELEAFSYSVAHDLRAPLRGIDGFSQALLEDCYPVLDETGKRYLSLVRTSAQHMARLIDEILMLSRVARADLTMSTLDLSAMAHDCMNRIRDREPGREVDVVIAPGLVGTGDPRLVAVVLDNLLGNAWKFTSKRPRARIEVGVVDEDGSPCFFVKDDGAGFDMQYAAKLFGVFQRLHSGAEFEGTGVGLATVQRIVHRHGGRIRAEAQVGKGATIRFTLGDRQ